MWEPLYILLIAIGFIHVATVDYCDPKMCPYQGKHIRCQNNGSFSKDCPANCTLVDILPYKKLILSEHRTYRNTLAEGNLKCYYSASRMPAMKWDGNLTENAEYNVKTCKFEHDKCRSTPDFFYAGQNIYTITTKVLNITLDRYIQEAIFLWFEEYLNANYTVMESFTVTKPQSGHFTVVMNDRVTRLGCALLDCFLPGSPIRRFILFTCDYASTNINKYPSYRPGKPAARCKTTHRLFTSLCTDKDIDANDFTWYTRPDPAPSKDSGANDDDYDDSKP